MRFSDLPPRPQVYEHMTRFRLPSGEDLLSCAALTDSALSSKCPLALSPPALAWALPTLRAVSQLGHDLMGHANCYVVS